ncbi:hypothetical protein SLE2022_198120 [Rubroshorea leprosula]
MPMETINEQEVAPPSGRNGGSNSNNASALANTEDMEAKKLKRVMASRQYSQRYRLKQLHYIIQLETEVKALQAEVMICFPRINYVDRQNLLLRTENGMMRQKLSAYTGELLFKEAQYEGLKKERDFWKQFFAVQQLQYEEINLTTNPGYRLLPLNIDVQPSHPTRFKSTYTESPTIPSPNCSTIVDEKESTSDI